MNPSKPRVRFAPSPTGYLHVGGARTALFNWLYARHVGGTFVLRIEDTDRERSSAAMTQAILDGMQWLGLDWDEGPLHQADGLGRHRADALRLLENGAAYRCFCTTEALEQRRRGAADPVHAFRYDRHCLRHVDAGAAEQRARAGEPHTVRFRVPEGVTHWDDAVHGGIEFSNADIEDFIVLRTDGTPIYNLAVVSDDIAMRITDVIRGDDHISNTPKQILLYRALGAALPRFAHVPMILGPDGKRLSKRHGATAVGEYQHQGILPDAMVNFLALLGWSPGTEQEVFSEAELVEQFSLEGINRKSAIFDLRKLEWLNNQHLNRRGAADIEPVVRRGLIAAGLATAEQLDRERAWFRRVIDLLKVRARNMDDIVLQARPYFDDEIAYDEEAVARHWKDAATAERLEALRAGFATLDTWEEAALEEVLRKRAEELGIGAGKLIHPLRVALTGMAVSPGIFEVAAVMGRARVEARLAAAVARLRARPGPSPGGPSALRRA
ncbi:MAG TPA: glutamate--tRNA ligase [Longimicrobiales bacterium]|nr:glutamate--tRNA ligase [Longimicrobiales bacterium]